MSIVLWVIQILLALHTAMGAVWKFSNSEQSVPSLSAIPHGLWLTLSVLELACAVSLILPAFYKPVSFLVPSAAALIAIEMLSFCALHLVSRTSGSGQLVYWLVVAIICTFAAYGRFVLRPF